MRKVERTAGHSIIITLHTPIRFYEKEHWVIPFLPNESLMICFDSMHIIDVHYI